MNAYAYNRGNDFESDWELIPELEAMLNENERFQRESSPTGRPATVAKHNTDLGAPYFGGNFNFLYNGGAPEATITFNTFISYRKNVPVNDRPAFEARLHDAIEMWNGAAQVQIKDRSGNFDNKITLRFKFNPVKDRRNSNKVTDVHPADTWSSWFNGKNREIVMRELNVFIGSSTKTLAHEMGHVWGLLDEYDAQWIEKIFSPGHVGLGSPLIKDIRSIMNIGFREPQNKGEFRTRHFLHFGRAIARAFWTVPECVIPNILNGKTVSKSIIGRIALLKKNMAGDPPYNADVSPFNPQFTYFQISKK